MIARAAAAIVSPFFFGVEFKMLASRALLNQIIDYAGLFPPASLSLPEVVRNYASYRSAPDSWMLARLIVPVIQLPQLADLAGPIVGAASNESPWKISCLVPGPDPDCSEFLGHWDTIAKFNAANRWIAVDAIETKADSPSVIAQAARFCPQSYSVFWEIPHTSPIDDLLTVISGSGSGHYAKIRTGGVQPQAIASIEDVARFVHDCAAAGVGFKATAGLHHPIRSEFPLTYERNAVVATMHGFLNVFVAAVFARTHQATLSALYEIIEDRDPGSFSFDDAGLSWKSMRASLTEIELTRAAFGIAFGSCSFVEPIDDLRKLALIGSQRTIASR